jgi:putative glutathione S-transferase
VRSLKGLQDTISVTIVHPTWKRTNPDAEGDDHCGWVFADPNGEPFHNTIGLGGPFDPNPKGCEADAVLGAKTIRDVYEHLNKNNGEKFSVPILFDKTLKTIVNNESSEIIRMLNSEFNAFAKNPKLDLYPEEKRTAIDEVNEWIYPNINNGVYRCGFAKSQEAYNKAVADLTKAMDRVESILQKQRFIAGDTMTEADIRLFVTLFRFDEVYIVYFKTNTRSVRLSPATLNFCREIYQTSGIAETCFMDQIKQHYFTSHPTLNRFSIIPEGNNFVELMEAPHTRNEL